MSPVDIAFLAGCLVGGAVFSLLWLVAEHRAIRAPRIVVPSARQMRRARERLHLGVIARRS